MLTRITGDDLLRFGLMIAATYPGKARRAGGMEAHWMGLSVGQSWRDSVLPISMVVTEIRRPGSNRIALIELPHPDVRYERERSREQVHLDIKKLGKIGRLGVSDS